MPVTTPAIPSWATPANRAIEAAASPSAATSTGLRPQDCERRPQNWLVTTTITAAMLIVTPMCHSARPTSRASGAMIGLRVI